MKRRRWRCWWKMLQPASWHYAAAAEYASTQQVNAALLAQRGHAHFSGKCLGFFSLQLYSTFAVDEMLAMKSRWTARKQNERRKITSTQTSIDDGDWTKWWISTVKQIAKTYTELKENKNSILLKLFKETKVFHRKTSVCLLFYVQLNLFVFDLVKVDKWTCSHNKTAKYLLWWARFKNFSCNILFFNVFHWW